MCSNSNSVTENTLVEFKLQKPFLVKLIKEITIERFLYCVLPDLYVLIILLDKPKP